MSTVHLFFVIVALTVLRTWSILVTTPRISNRLKGRLMFEKQLLLAASLDNNSPNIEGGFRSSDFMRDDIVLEKNLTSPMDNKKIVENNIKALERQKYIDAMLKQYGKQVNRKELEDSYDAASIRGNMFGEDSDRQIFNQSVFMDTPRTPPIEFEMFRMSNTSLELVSNSSESLFVRFLKDVYIGEEDDNPRRKQARFVLRSITFLSFAIGIAFTALWYIAPGKFISYRGDRDFSEKYSSFIVPVDDLDDVNKEYLQQYRIKPPTSSVFDSSQGGLIIRDSNSVLNQDMDSGRFKSEFMDDGVGVPENDMPRIPLESPRRLAPPSGRTIQL